MNAGIGVLSTAENLTKRYLLPLLNGDTTATSYLYNLHRQITNTLRPDGISVSMEFDSVVQPFGGSPFQNPAYGRNPRLPLQIQYGGQAKSRRFSILPFPLFLPRFLFFT